MSRTTIQIPAEVKACKGKKQCFTCEQTFASYFEQCPHCKASYEVPLSGAIDEEAIDWKTFDKQVEVLQRKATSFSRQELVSLLYKRAMEVRYRESARSLELFKMVFEHDPTHYEARLKYSWQALRLNKFEDVRQALKPIIESRTSTMEQKQRAYNNISCTFLFQSLPDYCEAERFAQLGLDLDTKGTSKLWENYGIALKAQGKLEESLTAFSRALLLEPESEFALRRQHSVEKQYKAQTKAQSKRFSKENKENKNKDNKENSLNEVPRDPPSRSKSVKMLFTKRKVSLGLTERA